MAALHGYFVKCEFNLEWLNAWGGTAAEELPSFKGCSQLCTTPPVEMAP